MVARATAPNKVGPESVFPDAAKWDFQDGLKGSPMASAPFWIAMICQIVIVIGYFWFYRKEQLGMCSNPPHIPCFWLKRFLQRDHDYDSHIRTLLDIYLDYPYYWALFFAGLWLLWTSCIAIVALHIHYTRFSFHTYLRLVPSIFPKKMAAALPRIYCSE